MKEKVSIEKQEIEKDTLYKCNVCESIGTVGRCCSDEDRTPLNNKAKLEQMLIKEYKIKQAKEEIEIVLKKYNLVLSDITIGEE